MAMVNPRSQIPAYCSCSAPSPEYTPKFEELSDRDLDALELVCLFEEGPPSEILDYSCDQIQDSLIGPRDCWRCLSKRRRREMIITAFGQPQNMTGDQLIQMLHKLECCMTPDQLEALLAYARYNFIISATNCFGT